MGQPCVPTYSLILIFLMQFYSIRVEVKQHGKNTLSQLPFEIFMHVFLRNASDLG